MWNEWAVGRQSSSSFLLPLFFSGFPFDLPTQAVSGFSLAAYIYIPFLFAWP